MPHLLGLGSPSILWCTSLESILESSCNTLQVARTSGTGGLSPLRLLAPVVYGSVSLTFPKSRVIASIRVLGDRG